MIGEKFNRLTVIELDTERTKEMAKQRTRKYYICQCECGNTTSVRIDHLKSGKVKGCWDCKNTTHGLTHHPMYHIWNNQMSRCNNIKNEKYERYGNRGVKVEYTLEEFIEWCDKNPQPSPEHTVDRIDNDGNYSLDNIRWADKVTQAINRRSTKEAKGVYKKKNRWRADITINKEVYRAYFYKEEDAEWWYSIMKVKRDIEESKKY